jgi:pyruvate, water dikinase
MTALVARLADIGMTDLGQFGGKNAFLGEMIRRLGGRGIRVPEGFATSGDAWREFLRAGGLEGTLKGLLHGVDSADVEQLTRRGTEIRESLLGAPLPPNLQDAVWRMWEELHSGAQASFAVRPSLTIEGSPEVSFAGLQNTLLNVSGFPELVAAIHEVYVSAYNDRTIAYCAQHGFDPGAVTVSVSVQRMVRSDLAAAGGMFTLDTESGFRDIVLITSAYGLGESTVEGSVSPDEFYVFKPILRTGKNAIVRRNLGPKARKLVYRQGSEQRIHWADVTRTDQRRFSLPDPDVLGLARLGLTIEEHFGYPMEVQWAKDGETGELFILQARPETVRSRSPQGTVRFSVKGEQGRVLARGRSVGQRVGAGLARVITDAREKHLLEPGDVLVTDGTDPDWEPVLRRAAAVVTDRGGRTCHAAILARELGIPAVVGCGNATASIPDRREVTVSCAEGDEGVVYAGRLDYELQEFRVAKLAPLPVKLLMNVGNPDRAFALAATPNDGIGLARLEFIINRMIGVHPRALLEYADQDDGVRERIDEQAAGYPDPASFFLSKLVEGIASLAAAFYPKPVTVRLSDFKSNEYANLIGGRRYEKTEQNPMLGFRGAARYLDDEYRACFELECRALKYVRERMGLSNIRIMVPFVRTVAEAERVVAALAANGLKRGERDLEIIMMCEVPSNVLNADGFLRHFDGMSIGSNDLTQLVLGVDRDSERVGALFDESDDAVKAACALAIAAGQRAGKPIGVCGEGISDHPELALWLVEQGAGSLSLNPDSLIDMWLYLAKRAGGPPER